MDWMKIGYALLLGAMIVLLLPKAKAMLQASRSATAADWRSIVLPLLLVVGFIMLLIASVS